MYKKIISVMSVMLVVFLCFNYDVKADEVIDSSRRYNWLSTTQHYGNVDVTGNLFCLSDNPAMQSVNLSSAEYVGGGTTQSVVSTWESVYLWKFQATYVLKNTGDTYETFDNGRLYSQFSVNAKASTSSSGSGSLTDDVVPSGWYIDNIQGATLTNALSDGTMYWSVDHTYYGNTLIIAPGETITFSYDINIFWWEQSFGVGGTTFSCNNGSISNTIGYTQQDGYNSYSVYEFITDYPFPSVDQYIADNINSIWANTQSLVSQGIVDQGLFNDIIAILESYPNPLSYVGYNRTYNFGYITYTHGVTKFGISFINLGVDYVDNDVDYSFADTNVRNLLKFRRRYIISLTNTSDDYVTLPWRVYIQHNGTINSNYQLLGTSYTFTSDSLIPNATNINYNQSSFYVSDIGRNPITLNPNSMIYIVYDVNYYYGSNTNDNLNITFGDSTFTHTDYTVTIADDPNQAVNSMEDQIHSQEQSYYQSTQQAITDTGIGNFSFDNNTSSGLSGLKDDFTAVWVACGTLSQYWIASLTIGLALSIIRHRKLFSK